MLVNIESIDPNTVTGLAAIALAGSTEVRSATGKLIHTVRDFLGWQFEPQRIRDIAEAEADARITAAKANAEVELIDAQGKIDVRNLKSRAVLRIASAQQREQANIESIVQEAAKQLPEDVSEKPVDQDWTAQFFEHCKNVGDEDMQRLWAQILAGEVASPKSYSLRTLSLVRLLTKDEANLFTRFCSTVWYFSERFEPVIYPPLAGHPDIVEVVTFDELIQLDSAGLIKVTPGGLFLNDATEEIWVYFDQIHRIKRKHSTGTKYSLPTGIATFTESGRQLAGLAAVASNEDYRKSIITRLESKGWIVEELPWPDEEPPS